MENVADFQMETETVVLYARVFPDLLESSSVDVEKRLQSLGKVLFALGGDTNQIDEEEVDVQKIDLRSPQSAAMSLFLFHVKVCF